jgi:hypothetical protein
MEKLRDIPAMSPGTGTDVFIAAFNGMQEHLWSRSWVMPWHPEMLFSKIERLAQKHFTRDVHRWLVIHWPDGNSLIRCRTHGDPTWDNLMIRGTEQLVYVDPIPATSSVPDLRSVDTGKMLQSIIGYERNKYGILSPWVCPVKVDTLKDLVDSNIEWQATVWWCVVHLIRRFPYATHYEIDGLKDLINATINLF